jgi:hypothetical protein
VRQRPRVFLRGRVSVPAAKQVGGLKEKMAATGYELPDIGMVDADDEGEEA